MPSCPYGGAILLLLLLTEVHWHSMFGDPHVRAMVGQQYNAVRHTLSLDTPPLWGACFSMCMQVCQFNRLLDHCTRKLWYCECAAGSDVGVWV